VTKIYSQILVSRKVIHGPALREHPRLDGTARKALVDIKAIRNRLLHLAHVRNHAHRAALAYKLVEYLKYLIERSGAALGIQTAKV
jgi:hypothetical protein